MTNLAGIVFAVDTDGKIFAQISQRADLAASRYQREQRDAADLARLKRNMPGDAAVQARVARRTIAGVILTNTDELAWKVLALVERFGRGKDIVAVFRDSDVIEALTACKRNGIMVYGLPLPKLKAKGPRVSDRRRGVIEKRTVEDPHLSGEELAHRLEQHALAPHLRQPGFVEVEINAEIQIGGLARVRGVTKAQKEGAKDFRRDAENALIGGSRAIDYSQPRVDTSGPTSPDVVESHGADARAWYGRACRVLGRVPLRLMAAERVIVDGDSIQETAVWLGLGNGGAARYRVRGLVLSACSELARLYRHDRTPRRRPRKAG